MWKCGLDSTGSDGTRLWPFGFHEVRRIFWPTELLTASEGRLSMKLAHAAFSGSTRQQKLTKSSGRLKQRDFRGRKISLTFTETILKESNFCFSFFFFSSWPLIGSAWNMLYGSANKTRFKFEYTNDDFLHRVGKFRVINCDDVLRTFICF
jgi:hypothetical protein